MPDTTSSSPSGSGGAARRSRSFASLWPALPALLLLLLAVPRLGAHLAMTVGNPGLDKLRRGEMLTEAGLERVRRSRETALAWLDLPRARIDLGYLHLRRALLANERGDLPEARAELEEAVAAFVRGLSREPVDPYAWHELAYAHLYAARPERAVVALAMSYRTGRYVPPLAPSRARLALVLWEGLAEDLRPWALRELTIAHRRDRETLETFARTLGLERRLRELLGLATGGYAF